MADEDTLEVDDELEEELLEDEELDGDVDDEIEDDIDAELDDELDDEIDDEIEADVDEDIDDDEDEEEEADPDAPAALDELEAEELDIVDEPAPQTMLVDEASEIRAIRREELTMDVEAGSPQTDEFVCSSCFLVRKRSQLANKRKMLCVDCA